MLFCFTRGASCRGILLLAKDLSPKGIVRLGHNIYCFFSVTSDRSVICHFVGVLIPLTDLLDSSSDIELKSLQSAYTLIPKSALIFHFAYTDLP